MSEEKLGGEFTFPGTPLTVNRIGYGAMQLGGSQCVGAAQGSGRCSRRTPRGRRFGREPYRYIRLLRSAHHQPDNPAGSASVPAGAGDCYQARNTPAVRRVVEVGHLPRRPG